MRTQDSHRAEFMVDYEFVKFLLFLQELCRMKSYYISNAHRIGQLNLTTHLCNTQ